MAWVVRSFSALRGPECVAFWSFCRPANVCASPRTQLQPHVVVPTINYRSNTQARLNLNYYSFKSNCHTMGALTALMLTQRSRGTERSLDIREQQEGFTSLVQIDQKSARCPRVTVIHEQHFTNSNCTIRCTAYVVNVLDVSLPSVKK